MLIFPLFDSQIARSFVDHDYRGRTRIWGVFRHYKRGGRKLLKESSVFRDSTVNSTVYFSVTKTAKTLGNIEDWMPVPFHQLWTIAFANVYLKK